MSRAGICQLFNRVRGKLRSGNLFCGSSMAGISPGPFYRQGIKALLIKSRNWPPPPSLSERITGGFRVQNCKAWCRQGRQARLSPHSKPFFSFLHCFSAIQSGGLLDSPVPRQPLCQCPLAMGPSEFLTIPTPSPGASPRLVFQMRVC